MMYVYIKRGNINLLMKQVIFILTGFFTSQANISSAKLAGIGFDYSSLKNTQLPISKYNIKYPLNSQTTQGAFTTFISKTQKQIVQ